MYKYIILTLCFLFNSAVASTESIENEYYSGQVIESPTDTYTIERKLGEGAFGCVYLAKNKQGIPFAIKTYKDDHPKHDLFEDPQREFERGQILNHPNIIKSIELFTFENINQIATTNLVLEFVDGQTLWKTDRGEIQHDESIMEVQQCLDAIKSAFSEGYMHLDLHSGNVMIDKNGKFMVVDLGSFYNKSEIFDYVIYFYLSKASTSEDYTRGTSKDIFGLAERFKAPYPLLNKPKNLKLKQFFDQNPKILNEMVDLWAKEMKKNAAMQFIREARDSSNFEWAKDTREIQLLAPVYSYYMNRISDICMEVIRKSNRSRDEKIILFTQIKMIFWNFQEDLYDQKHEPFESYLEEMSEIVGT